MIDNAAMFDTHAHLTLLEHSPLAEILERARAAQVTKMITVSTNQTNWEPNRLIAEAHNDIYFSVGLHPHDAKDWPLYRETFEQLPRSPKRVAVGETGLDFHYNLSDREAQITAFEEQLNYAKLWDLPVIVHCRDAFNDLFHSIKKVGLSHRGGVMHCFTGSLAEAKASLDIGFKISFSGILTFKTAATLRETARQLPISHLFIETDCPFLAPIPNRGKPNEPAYLPLTAQVLAQVKGMDAGEVARVTSENAIAFFAV